MFLVCDSLLVSCHDGYERNYNVPANVYLNTDIMQSALVLFEMQYIQFAFNILGNYKL